MAFAVGAIVGELQLRKDKWDQSIKKVKADQKSLSGLVVRNSAQFKKMGRSMTVAGGLIVGTMGAMVKAYGNFDEAMTKSLAIMGDISPAMRKEMEKTAKQLSTQSTFAAKELGEAYFFLASAGMNAEQSISALAPVARFAQAGTFDLSLATDLLTDAQTALGLSTEDVVENEKNLIRVSDVLVGANTLANASVLQFAESLTNKAAAALVNLNKEVEEGVAVLAAYADKGVKGRLAGQRLTMMLNGLFDATRRNKKAWDAAGISLFNADESMRDIADIIQDLEGYLGVMTVKQREAELAVLGFNLKTKDSILTLMGSSEKIRRWTGDLKKMGGITKTVADKQMEAFNAKMKVLKNVVTNAAIAVGESLAPMIESLGVKIKSVTEAVTEWIEKHPELTEIISKSALGIGALLLVLGPLAMMLPGLVLGFKLLLPVVSALASPVTLLVAAIAGIAISVQTLADNLTTAKKAMSDFREETLIFKNAAENFQKLWITVREEGGEALEQFNELFTRFGGNWDKILKQIIADPKHAILKTLLFELATGLKTISLEGEDLSIKLPDAFGKAGKGIVEAVRVNTEEVLDLISDMEDEIFEVAHNEFEVRTRMARKTYEERKALLDKEKANDEAYAITKKAYNAELNQIEKDRTQKLQEEIKERASMLQAAIDAGFDAQKRTRDKIQALHAGYTNIVKRLTLSEKDYKVWALDEWYKTELEKVKENTDAKLELDEAYKLKQEKLAEAGKTKWQDTMKEVLAGVGSVIGAMDSMFGQFHANEAMRIDNEEKKRTDAIESWNKEETGAIESWYEREKEKIELTIANEEERNEALAALEEEKVAKMEALDEEKARKENELQHNMDKERRKLERKKAKQQKVSALFSAGMNVAEAITKALTAGPLIGQIFAGIVAALGAIQVAAIAAAPLPALAMGGHIGGPAIVGERGPEIFFPDTSGTIIPVGRESTGRSTGGAKINLNFFGPLIQSTGIARRDIDETVEYWFSAMEREANRRGYSLAGGVR